MAAGINHRAHRVRSDNVVMQNKRLAPDGPRDPLIASSYRLGQLSLSFGRPPARKKGARETRTGRFGANTASQTDAPLRR